MATTTNYSWTTPDDTALVKDGAAAIRTLGSSIDTTTKNLNPETTLGDISYRSSTANTNTRLAIGTTGQVLTVSGGVPAWATASSGGMTLLSTTTLSGASTVISSISGSYNSLFGVVYGVTNATANGTFRCNTNSTANILSTGTRARDGATSEFRSSTSYLVFSGGYSMDRTSSDNGWSFRIDNYTTTARKPVTYFGGGLESTGGNMYINQAGFILETSAITSLTFDNTGGNLSTGTVLLYGVK